MARQRRRYIMSKCPWQSKGALLSIFRRETLFGTYDTDMTLANEHRINLYRITSKFKILFVTFCREFYTKILTYLHLHQGFLSKS